MHPEGQHDPALAPGTMVGGVRIEALVGEGGMGQVYGAVHPVIGKRAAIGVPVPEIGRNHQMVERFVMEARSVNQIGHPNIVDVFTSACSARWPAVSHGDGVVARCGAGRSAQAWSAADSGDSATSCMASRRRWMPRMRWGSCTAI